MAKEITGYVKLQIKGGQANPAPPVGPALGQRGINIMEFCKAFNEKTKAFMGKPVPVVITVYKDKKFNFKLQSTHNTFIYLVNGEIEVGKNKHDNVKDSTLILLTRGEELTVKAKSDAKFLLISGKPINEEIARGGPFVMNTKAEILQAVQDYHNDTFVK